MPFARPIRPGPAPTPLRAMLLAASALAADLGLGTLVEQGRGVPWGGVLTVVGQAILHVTG